MTLVKRMTAEFIGTFWLAFGGIGTAVMAAMIPELKVGTTGIALAFGLTLLTMAYVFGNISGCHINPAVTIGLCAAKRFPFSDVIPYTVAQVIGAIAGAGLVYAIASGKEGFSIAAGLGSNGYGTHSPGGYSLYACLLAEVILTFMFVFIIIGASGRNDIKAFAPIPVGLALTLVNLVGIPITNMSVNPARSTGPALFVGDWALSQLWLFWLAPIAGGILAGLIYQWLFKEQSE